MDVDEIEEEEFGFSRNYFLAKELGSSSRKKSARKLSEIDLVDEEVCVLTLIIVQLYVQLELIAPTVRTLHSCAVVFGISGLSICIGYCAMVFFDRLSFDCLFCDRLYNQKF